MQPTSKPEPVREPRKLVAPKRKKTRAEYRAEMGERMIRAGYRWLPEVK